MKTIIAILATASTKDLRIIGGGIVTPHSRPHVLSLQENRSHYCGGTIISSTAGVTTGLCKVSGPSIYAIAGAHNIRRTEPSQQSAKVTFTLHPKFNTRTRANDLAIIKFENAFEINEYVKPIQMAPAADDETVQAKEKVQICGWGINSVSTENYPNELHCVTTKYVPRDICNDADHYSGIVPQHTFCAGELDVGGRDPCSGDYGGPLTHDDLFKGVASWGIECSFKKFPAIYTDISQFRGWIDSEL